MKRDKLIILLLVIALSPIGIALINPSTNTRLLKIEILKLVNVYYEEGV